MRLLDLVRNPTTETRALSDVTSMFTGMGPEPEGIANNFPAFVQGGYKDSSPVFALIGVRARSFSEATFKFRNLDTNELETRPRLEPLRRPWPNGTIGDLLTAIEIDVSLAGTSFTRRLPGNGQPTTRLQRLRPDWVEMLKGDNGDGSVDLIGYVYYPGGKHSGSTPVPVLAGDVALYTEHPDPAGHFRGQSWITAATREVDADTSMSRHKNTFFTNAATPNLVVSAKGKVSEDQRRIYQAVFERQWEGWENAYKTILLEGGADVKVVGQSMEQMSFAAVQAAGETRLAAAAGVPPIVADFVQGIQASTYSNYAQALRKYADLSVRPRWRSVAGSLETIFPPPDGFDLWYDDRDIPFLQQDALDAAKIRQTNLLSIESAVRSGFKPESAVAAVETDDLTKLEWSGLTSVQLLPPGTTDTPDDDSDDEEPSDD
jgi:HK97 family phage portal protein